MINLDDPIPCPVCRGPVTGNDYGHSNGGLWGGKCAFCSGEPPNGEIITWRTHPLTQELAAEIERLRAYAPTWEGGRR